jgi:hypothetical protein
MLKTHCHAHKKIELVDGRCYKCDEYYENRKLEAKEKGLCHNHRTPLENGRCAQCDQNYITRRDKAISENRCPKHFHTFMVDGKCPRCLEFRKNRRKIAKENRTCHRHQVALVAGKCSICQQIKAERDIFRAQLKRDGRCLQHYDEQKPCKICKQIKIEKKQFALENNVCFSHPSEPAITGMYCHMCWCKSLASDALGSKKKWKVIEKFFQEKGNCAYTGLKLLPGSKDYEASIDHIIPLSKGGQKTLENLQWVCNIVNRSKFNLTHEEYLEQLKRIYNFSFGGGVREKGKMLVYTNPDRQQCYRHYCSEKPLIGSACELHYFYSASSKNLGTVKYADELKKILEKQKYCCVYTGTNIILGANSGKNAQVLIILNLLLMVAKKSSQIYSS